MEKWMIWKLEHWMYFLFQFWRPLAPPPVSPWKGVLPTFPSLWSADCPCPPVCYHVSNAWFAKSKCCFQILSLLLLSSQSLVSRSKIVFTQDDLLEFAQIKRTLVSGQWPPSRPLLKMLLVYNYFLWASAEGVKHTQRAEILRVFLERQLTATLRILLPQSVINYLTKTNKQLFGVQKYHW